MHPKRPEVQDQAAFLALSWLTDSALRLSTPLSRGLISPSSGFLIPAPGLDHVLPEVPLCMHAAFVESVDLPVLWMAAPAGSPSPDLEGSYWSKAAFHFSIAVRKVVVAPVCSLWHCGLLAYRGSLDPWFDEMLEWVH